MKLVGDTNWSFETNFSLKDEKSLENLVRIKPTEKMYLIPPLTTVNCPHKLPSLMDLTNHVCMMILEDSYPDYSSFDPTVRRMFKQEVESKDEEIVLVKEV